MTVESKLSGVFLEARIVDVMNSVFESYSVKIFDPHGMCELKCMYHLVNFVHNFPAPSVFVKLLFSFFSLRCVAQKSVGFGREMKDTSIFTSDVNFL